MKLFCAMIGCLFIATQAGAAEEFRVSTVIKQHGEVVASPILQMSANKLATIRIADSLEFEVLLQPEQADSVMVATKLKTGEHLMQPRFATQYGKKVTLTQGAQQLELQVDKIVTK